MNSLTQWLSGLGQSQTFIKMLIGAVVLGLWAYLVINNIQGPGVTDLIVTLKVTFIGLTAHAAFTGGRRETTKETKAIGNKSITTEIIK